MSPTTGPEPAKLIGLGTKTLEAVSRPSKSIVDGKLVVGARLRTQATAPYFQRGHGCGRVPGHLGSPDACTPTAAERQ